MIPSCFRSVTHLDLSLLSPWGHSLFCDSSQNSQLLAQFLRIAFPSVYSLILYSRTPSTLQLLAPQWPNLRHVKLVRWHQRSQSPLGSDFFPLFENCTSLTSLDLSHFYCWTEDLPAALEAHPSVSASLTRLNLLMLPSPEGFKSHELIAISAACPKLNELLVACMFDPRYIDFVGDEAVVALASNCPLLKILHLVNTTALSDARGDPNDDGYTSEDARISHTTLENLFTRLPLIEEFVLDICHNVRDSGVVLEMLNSKCPRLRLLMLGQFHGICRPMDTKMEGIAVCKGLESLSIKNCADLSDSSLMGIALGCPRLKKFHMQGCKKVTEDGMKNFTCVLRKTLIDVKISSCKNLDIASALEAMESIRTRIQRLHIDCVWHNSDESDNQSMDGGLMQNSFDLNELDEEASMSSPCTDPNDLCFPATKKRNADCFDETKSKKCRYWAESQSIICKNWDRLEYLSLWIPVGDTLDLIGLEICPVLEEIQIKVEGDCRSRPKPNDESFGLSCLAVYPQLSKMKLDCGDAIGYALTAPNGQFDLSLWERFYLNGIGHLNLNEFDYWPPQDRDVNHRSLSLPAAGLLGECTTLRKLYIHGTTHEHFLRFLLNIPNLRDMQLREDYYPAPEDDMSTEMRVTSCCRFEDALNRREIPD